jgi:hypothetical protein
MSRGYRISWGNQSATAVAKATDRTELGVALLGLLPEAEMQERLRAELESAGWKRQKDGSLTRSFGEATATLSPDATSIHLEISKETSRRVAPAAVAGTTEALQKRLEKDLVLELTAQEGEMRAEVDAAVQRTYAGALKEKAARLGAIESVTEGRSADGNEEIVIKVRL